MTNAVASAVAACVVAVALAACAAPTASAARAAPAPLRVMVKLARASEDRAAIAAEVTRVAGVPASYAAATSADWHALVLHCADAAACDAAIARLRAAGAVYHAVEIDGRKAPAS